MRSKTKINEEVVRLKRDDGTLTSNEVETSELLNNKFQGVFVREPPGASTTCQLHL